VRAKRFVVLIICCALAGCAAAVFAAARQGFDWAQWASFLMVYAAVAAAAAYDYKRMLIPNWIPLALLLARAALFGAEFAVIGGFPPELPDAALGCVLSGTILLTASKLSKGGVGAGDVKLFAAIGFACGLGMAFSLLLLALLSCAVAGGALVAVKKKAAREALPFAPFIWFGFVLNALFMAL
jgi:prepilin signal peptidase PulO-like enzyme (type II secretory pathway)